MTLSEELIWRGFINQTTYKDITDLDKEPITFYFGVDPSADSMTIGNLAAAMMVRKFMEYGHKAILLVGGATGMIGDPDGKASERNLLSLEQIEKNRAGISTQYQQVFAGKEFTLVDNYDWFKDMNYLNFLREVGKHVPLNQMLGRDFVQKRIDNDGSGISYAEFSYSLIQGYDFLHLERTYDVSLQVCGADQWGNALTGVDLIRRLDGKEAHIFTLPLVINKTTGQKFGKSEGGAIWLDPARTSIYQFYQFWLNLDDEGVGDYLKIYTLLPKEELEPLMERHTHAPHAREAQRVLADAITTIVHGEERAQAVKHVTDVLFGSSAFSDLSPSELDVLAQEIPVIPQGKTLIESLVESRIATSNGEAKRLLAGGAITFNGEKMHEDRALNERGLIKKGKNSFILVR